MATKKEWNDELRPYGYEIKKISEIKHKNIIITIMTIFLIFFGSSLLLLINMEKFSSEIFFDPLTNVTVDASDNNTNNYRNFYDMEMPASVTVNLDLSHLKCITISNKTNNSSNF